MNRFRNRCLMLSLLACIVEVIVFGLVACESGRYAQNQQVQSTLDDSLYADRFNSAPHNGNANMRFYDSQSSSNMGRKIPAPSLSSTAPIQQEGYAHVPENRTRSVTWSPLSTFSIDVDTASYSNIRRFINQGQKPPVDAVRIEEMVNYFSYAYPQPEDGRPISVTAEVGPCPWDEGSRLLRLGLKGREMERSTRMPSNLVFLVDVSGSMSDAMKLPLVIQSMRMLVRTLGAEDHVGIVVYAGASGVVLEPTSCANEQRILDALDRLRAGGSTNGGEGLKLAYDLAQRNYVKGGINRVILCTDGDFNVGVTGRNDLVKLVKKRAASGVYLTILGFGQGNLKDATLEAISNDGNGNHAYIDSLQEARKVLVEQGAGTLVTIAKDVKVQIEFNPAVVKSYRLVGYENRILAKQDFNNDAKDAGDMGAGHTVTALYELVTRDSAAGRGNVDPLKYQLQPSDDGTFDTPSISDELLTVKIRYKEPEGHRSQLMSFPVVDHGDMTLSADSRFAAAVAGFGMILRDAGAQHRCTFDTVRQLAQSARGQDPSGHRAEFLRLVEMVESMN